MQIERDSPKEFTLHLILDNYATHNNKKQEVRESIGQKNRSHLKRYGIKRFKLHFTLTCGSWMNLIERFFGDPSQQAIFDGSFTHVRGLVQRIEEYIAQHNLRLKTPKSPALATLQGKQPGIVLHPWFEPIMIITPGIAYSR